MPHERAPAAKRRAARKRALEHGIFAVFPLLWIGFLFNFWLSNDNIAFDFHHYYWPAGDRVLHGLSPYVHGPWYPAEVPVGFVYPAPTALIFAAVATIPREIGEVLFAILALAAPLVSLRLLDVRDWRVYGLVLLWAPVIVGVQTANLSMLFTVAVAAMWRYRDRPLVIGIIFGVVVAMKLFLAPLALFLLATRRFTALAYGGVTTACLMGFAWVVIGTDELARYRATVEEFTHLREDYGYSIIGLVDRLGGGRPVAYAAALAVAGVVAVASVVMGRAGRESDSFILALAVALLVTPILWIHYFVFLLVVIGLRCPVLRPLWALPLLFYLDAAENPTVLQVSIALAVGALVVVLALRTKDPWRTAPAHPAPAAPS